MKDVVRTETSLSLSSSDDEELEFHQDESQKFTIMDAKSFQKEQQERAFARKMLARAEKVLKEVDNSYIIKERGHQYRQMPAFRPEELSLGKVLGTGGFGIVNEITGIFPDESLQNHSGSAEQSEADNKAPLDNPQEDGCRVGSTPDPPKAPEPLPEDDDDDEDDGEAADVADIAHALLKKSDSNVSGGSGRVRQVSDEFNTHYEIGKAKQLMSRRATRKGQSRYALKRLHGGLTELEEARGMIDMALEAKFLSVVWHPNIIKMRGLASGPLVDKGFFIVLDRLEMTLDVRMNEWTKTQKKNRGFAGGLIGKKKDALKDLLVDRMTVAYDLAAAFMYLHENRLVYRDIKPENIGFDVRGDVKVFDFGLCKNLAPHLKNRQGYGYKLTGRAGSLPYMAPEVCSMQSYDTKCDVFSFAILLWEILMLKPAFAGFTPSEFVEKVVIDHERLPVPKQWPPLTRLMMPEAWDPDPINRPDMKRVAILIRGDLNDMTDQDIVLHRTRHMRERSDHSMTDLTLGL